MPHVELIDNIRRDIHTLDEKQLSLVDHFEDMKLSVQKVTNDFLSLRQAKGGEIIDDNFLRDESNV